MRPSNESLPTMGGDGVYSPEANCPFYMQAVDLMHGGMGCGFVPYGSDGDKLFFRAWGFTREGAVLAHNPIPAIRASLMVGALSALTVDAERHLKNEA